MGAPEQEVDTFPEGCLLLLLYMYITSRPDSAATDMQWLHLEQEVTPRPPCEPHSLRPLGEKVNLGAGLCGLEQGR